MSAWFLYSARMARRLMVPRRRGEATNFREVAPVVQVPFERG